MTQRRAADLQSNHNLLKHPKVPALSTQHKASQGASTLDTAQSIPRCQHSQQSTKRYNMPALSTVKASQGARTLNKVQSITRCQHSQQSTVTRKTLLQRPVVADIQNVNRTKQPQTLWRKEDRQSEKRRTRFGEGRSSVKTNKTVS